MHTRRIAYAGNKMGKLPDYIRVRPVAAQMDFCAVERLHDVR